MRVFPVIYVGIDTHTHTHTQALSLSLSLSHTHTCVCVCVCVCVCKQKYIHTYIDAGLIVPCTSVTKARRNTVYTLLNNTVHVLHSSE
jgi:hypothetical protein